jgi:hypothetical protein
VASLITGEGFRQKFSFEATYYSGICLEVLKKIQRTPVPGLDGTRYRGFENKWESLPWRKPHWRMTSRPLPNNTELYTVRKWVGLTAGPRTATFSDLLCILLYYNPSTIMYFECSVGFHLQGRHDARLVPQDNRPADRILSKLWPRTHIRYAWLIHLHAPFANRTICQSSFGKITHNIARTFQNISTFCPYYFLRVLRRFYDRRKTTKWGTKR